MHLMNKGYKRERFEGDLEGDKAESRGKRSYSTPVKISTTSSVFNM